MYPWGLCTYFGYIIRVVRGHKQKMRKSSLKLGKNTKNRLKIKEKAKILAHKNFQKRGNQLKRGTVLSHPCIIECISSFTMSKACSYLCTTLNGQIPSKYLNANPQATLFFSF